MTTITEQIFETAMSLCDEERIRLAERLIGSISPDRDILTAQLEEIDKRAADLASGEAIAIPGEAALRMVREASRKGRVA